MWLVRHGTWEKYEYIEVNTISEAVDISQYLQDEGVQSEIIHCSTPHAKIQRELGRRRDNIGNIQKPEKGTWLHSKALKSIAELMAYWSKLDDRKKEAELVRDRVRQQELDKLRSTTLYGDEALKVVYKGDAANFPKDEIMTVYPRAAKYSGLPYPLPKWVACDYYVVDLDGDKYTIAEDRYGKLDSEFEWVKED